MTSYSMGAFCPYIECAPCPPFFVVDIYQILVNVSLSVNLTEHDYRAIAKRCNIQEPTTTTTTTTTPTSTTTTSVTTTNERTSVTTISTTISTTMIATPSTQAIASVEGISVNVSKTSDIISSTKYIPISTDGINIARGMSSSSSNSGVTTSSAAAYITSTTERTTTSTEGTGLTTGGSKRRHRWPYCNDVCLIIAITSSTCAFLVLLVVLALCCRRKHPHDKATSRSSSSQILVANGTYERTNSIDRHGGVVWRNIPGIENLGYRKSLEMREPLKYMDSDQNWEDLDYYAAGKDGSLRSNKSQRSDSSPRRKRRNNKDKRQNSTEKLNQTQGLVFIHLSERQQRSLPKIPSETQTISDKLEYSYLNGIRFLSLPRTPKQRNGTEHTRSKSESQSRPRTKQRPRSFEQLNTHSKNVYVDIPEYPSQTGHVYSEPNQIRNDLKLKDTNLRLTQNREVNSISRQKTKPDGRNPCNPNGQNISNSRGPNRRFNRDDTVFPATEASSSPKFYPPYRDPNKQNVIFTTRL